MDFFNINNILEFCYKIDICKNIIDLIPQKYYLIDENIISEFYYDFFENEKAEEAYKKLQQYTDNIDSDKICELIVLLSIAIKSYENYKKKGIDEKIYIDTMKCFSRFIKETYKWTGKYTFDRGFWVWRQLSLVLFRIGQLEFEVSNIDETLANKLNINKNNKVLYVHIPSDAICTIQELEYSYYKANEFFKKYFNAEYLFLCSSWLLGKELEYLIKENSGIYNFRKDYEIIDYFESDDYIQWVFDKFDGNIKDFIPKTNLQKSIKQHIIDGGKMTVGLGILKK